MIEKAYEITDFIDESRIKKRLDEIKLKINNNEEAKKIIKCFESAKELYEKYNVKEDFIKAKKALFSNELLKEYVSLQEQINLLTIKINNRIRRITNGVTNKK